MDILTNMRAFVAVAETGQFTTASDRLGLSRAMASKQVMDLEAHLGARLLNRKHALWAAVTLLSTPYVDLVI
jgi:DNA-binding transcriptional LysR family regulator